MIARVVTLLVVLACSVGAQETPAPIVVPQVPIAATPAATVHEGDAVAPVPQLLTICIDRTAQRCWSAVDPAECGQRSRGAAEIFATVASISPEAGQRLRACWDEVKH